MAKRYVIWTKTADLQYVGVLEYWVNRNKSNTYSKNLWDYRQIWKNHRALHTSKGNRFVSKFYQRIKCQMQ